MAGLITDDETGADEDLFGAGMNDAPPVPVSTPVGQGSDDLIAVPSGQPVTLIEVIRSEATAISAPALRFRFLAPAIAQGGGAISYEDALTDIMALCETYALPRADAFGPRPDLVIISLTDRALPFGETAPEVTQYFEGYSIEGDICIWEMF